MCCFQTPQAVAERLRRETLPLVTGSTYFINLLFNLSGLNMTKKNNRKGKKVKGPAPETEKVD
jgi:hypothetical protein